MFKRLLCAAACLMAVASGKTHIQSRIRNGEIASRTVNLGGWLLTEYWMCYTSPLYKGVDEKLGLTGEYSIMKFLGKETGTKQFEEHRSTWITEEDIAEIAKAGLNTVRVSTGYWIINDEDDRDQSDVAQTYAKGGLKYLDKLINEWAVKYNLAVMVSLHAHKGSQNGLDHSAPVEMQKIGWGETEDSITSSFNYATFIANRYKDSEAFLGLNLMNEPTRPLDYVKLLKYYEDAYKAIRADGNDCIIATSPWLEHQTPKAPNSMDNFLKCPDNYNVWHEFHIYYKWGWENVPFQAVLTEAAKYGSTHFDGWTGNPIYVGEWSLATEKEQETDEQMKQFAAVQMVEKEKAPAGWAFWSWRHADEPIKTSAWSLRQLLRKGLITIPKTEPLRAPRSECPVVPGRNSSKGSSGDSGSGSIDLPGKVTPVDPETNTPKKTDAPTQKDSSATAVQKVGVTLLVGISSMVALTL